MKAATGEMNMAVIVVLAVAIIGAFFYTVAWPMLRDNQDNIVNCRRAICGTNVGPDGRVDCTFDVRPLRCTWKG